MASAQIRDSEVLNPKSEEARCLDGGVKGFESVDGSQIARRGFSVADNKFCCKAATV